MRARVRPEGGRCGTSENEICAACPLTLFAMRALIHTSQSMSATMSVVPKASDAKGGVLGSDRLGREVGPGGVEANHSRVVAGRLAETASDDIALLSQPGVLRCCNCGLAVTPAMRLPVFDPHDPVLGPDGTASVRENGWRLDYVRVVLEYDELRTPSFEYSGFVACTAPCALRFAYNHPSFQPSQVPHMHANMMWERHRIDEPTVAAPCSDCLAYVHRSTRITSSDSKTSGRGGEVGTKSSSDSKTSGRGGEVGTKSSSDSKSSGRGGEVGLTARAFYRLLARVTLQGRKQSAPGYIPPVGEEEQSALERQDKRFVQYYYQDVLPPHVAGSLGLPPDLEDGGIQLDANPDSDAEADLATDTLHPPNPSSAPPPSSAHFTTTTTVHA